MRGLYCIKRRHRLRGSWQAVGETEGEQLAALGSSELFPFRLLITFAATFPVSGDSFGVEIARYPKAPPHAVAPFDVRHYVPRYKGNAQFGTTAMCLSCSASLHPAQRALSSCPVAGQLGDSWPGKRSKYQIAQKQTTRICVLFAFVVSGSYLSSRAVASQVLSAYKGLTSVFGMGTGGTP